MGGPGSERDVSFATGKGVAKALRSLGAEVTEVDVKGPDFELPAGIELAFIAIHGTFGEDGQVQKILEERGIAYTGEGVAESELAFDKIRSKEAFRQHGVTTPYWQIVTVGQRPTIPIPFVIKAPRQGSTVGVHIIKNEREIDAAMADARQVRSRTPGREVHSGPRADDRNSRRPGAADYGDHPEGRLLRFHEQVSVSESERRWRRGACLSGENS